MSFKDALSTKLVLLSSKEVIKRALGDGHESDENKIILIMDFFNLVQR
jgi:hypothetical protein